MGELLFYEYAWVMIFLQLREGSLQTEEDVPGGRGVAIFMKSSGRDRETLQVLRSGEKPLKLSVHKALADDQSWRARVAKEEKKFNDLATGKNSVKVVSPAIAAERELWEALKRARTAAQVRRICNQSCYWLKWKWEREWHGKRSHFESPSPCPRALYDHAKAFCRAKRDPRYPSRDRRESGDYRRIEYLARVMAGLSLVKPIPPATAVDLLRKMNHPEKCVCWRCKLKLAPRFRERSLARFLSNKIQSED
jgi:hypothetical protein